MSFVKQINLSIIIQKIDISRKWPYNAIFGVIISVAYDNDRIVTQFWYSFPEADILQMIANQSPANRSPSPTNRQSIAHQSPPSPWLVANWSPIFKNSSRAPLANRSAVDRQLIADWYATKSVTGV